MPKNLSPNFLIIGCERSGTHWVAALLNSHPEIACFPSLPWRGEDAGNTIGEVHFFNTVADLYPAYRTKKYVRPFEDFLYKYNKVFADLVPLKDKIPLDKLMEKLIIKYSDYCDAQKGNKKIVGESTPAYIFFLDFMDTLYPSMKKLCSVRDPKDKIVSWHYNLIRKDKKSPDSEITEDFALRYLTERIIPEYEALLEYKKEVFIITYERMHRNTKKVASEMVKYLGFTTNEDELDEMVSEASFQKQTERDGTPKGRVSGQEDIKSGLRKGIVGDWENNMDKALAEKIDTSVAKLREEVFDKYHVIE